MFSFNLPVLQSPPTPEPAMWHGQHHRSGSLSNRSSNIHQPLLGETILPSGNVFLLDINPTLENTYVIRPKAIFTVVPARQSGHDLWDQQSDRTGNAGSDALYSPSPEGRLG